MKIALLTIWHERNFGAELQAYATIKALTQLSHDVRMIDIRLSDMCRPSLKGRVGNFLSLFGPSTRKFNSFWSEYFPVTRRYTTVEQLQQNPPDADAYIVGSDQVWNPEITRSFAKIFFLDFGPESVRRISYASSFGVERWESYNTEVIAKLLARFQSVSCREKSGAKILKETFGIDSTNVLDPTLLFENYMELTGSLIETPTLAYYPLGSSPELESYSKNLATKLGLKAINASWQKNIYGTAVWDRNSIEGWIRDIAQARFVITPSFHGLAMCLIHHRQFAVLVQNSRRATRMESLLDLVGLRDRIFYSFEELNEAQPWIWEIDYESVDGKLSVLRARSFEFLKTSLA